ncbi:transposase [Pseudonocardia sp. S2-4]|uniref:Transposase n=1 Tax=Pseudonocardia humida TaxID=2800819 RepID=A0ABT1A257_9PSEU|nr:transposase [Pseudonocardia humida]
MVRTGCSWRQLPKDFPPWETVYWYFSRWEDVKVTEEILAAVREQLRVAEAATPSPAPGWWTPRRSRAPTPSAPTAAARRREEDQRPEAVHRHRHPRPTDHVSRGRAHPTTICSV